MATIPQTQTVAWVDTPQPGAQLRIRDDVPVPSIGEGEVLVKLEYTGFCHSDVHNILGDLPMSTHIPGHEGVGVVVSVGPGVSSDMLGKRVGIKWTFRACKKCGVCEYAYVHCPNQDNSGRNVPGTFQQYIAAPADFVSPIPDNLDPAATAPLLCAGVTMIGALKKLDNLCKKGDSVVIVGAGGGLGHLGLQIGRAMGYRMIAIDSGKKKDLCLRSGASEFVDFTAPEPEKQVKALTGGIGAPAVVVVVGNGAGYNLGLQLLRPQGALVCVGLPPLDYKISLTPLTYVNSGYHILGSAVGTEDEVQELFKMAAEGRVSTHYEVYDFKRVNEALEKLVRYEVDGRVVLKIPQ
ncbi:hypothetical protein VTN49DRAFT_428 [Thermomyces lanuginosus]|uniref:uncharacterized protein n=1 Tax=Thermomyces lanuginosus TaxID=5541 RepID=UPI003743B78B